MTELEHLSDAELLARTPGEPDAFATFYRRHSRAVLAFVARRAAAPDVGDLVAEVFATALVHCRRYDPARGAAGAWLTGIAANLLAGAARRGAVEARMCRRLGIRRPVLEEVSGIDADVVLELGGEELLGSLPRDQRVAVEARVLHDKDYDQIALEQSVSPQVVRKRVSRGLGALRARLKEEE
ncbi:MAG: RNA polymerase sigma factor [Solirubrobacterales bacterium]|nr:RNA polymerase sigma factor [Solirubrobacterales bacterium]